MERDGMGWDGEFDAMGGYGEAMQRRGPSGGKFDGRGEDGGKDVGVCRGKKHAELRALQPTYVVLISLFCGVFVSFQHAEWRSGPAHLRAEKDVFWLMLALMSRLGDVGSGLGMRELWLPGVPQLKVALEGGGGGVLSTCSAPLDFSVSFGVFREEWGIVPGGEVGCKCLHRGFFGLCF